MSVEDKYQNSICLVRPVSIVDDENMNIPLDPNINLHVTLKYLGDINDVNFTRDDVESLLASLLIKQESMVVPIESIELFGQEKNFLVLLLEAGELTEEYSIVHQSFMDNNITNPLVHTYPFLPHVTVREGYKGTIEGLVAPAKVVLGAPVLWWGSDRG